jgi:enterochelin esterase family protein
MRLAAAGAVAFLLAACPAMAGPSEVRRDQAIDSPALGRQLTFELYLPPDRDGLGGLPVIYLLHGTESSGADWLDKGDLKTVADRMMSDGEMPKSVIVMPNAGNSWYVDSPLPAGQGAMWTALTSDLPGWIESHLPVGTARGSRAIGGYSMGGFGALRAGVILPERYSAVAVMSGAFWAFLKPDTPVEGKLATATRQIFDGAFGDPFEPARFVSESPLTLARLMPPTAPRPDLLMICGRHEVFGMREEQEAAMAVLGPAGFAPETALTDGDHDWDNWKGMLPRVLGFLGRHLSPGGPVPTVARGQAGSGHS